MRQFSEEREDRRGGRLAARREPRLPVQRRVVVGPAVDRSEREADQMADRVIELTGAAAPPAGIAARTRIRPRADSRAGGGRDVEPGIAEPSSRVRRSTIQRVQWDKATKRTSGRAALGSYDFYGKLTYEYDVPTDKSRAITAYRPDDGATYDCHGYTFKGHEATGGPFSPDGAYVPTITEDEYKYHGAIDVEPPIGDVAVFHERDGVAHSGIVAAVDPGGEPPYERVKVRSKKGSKAITTQTVRDLAVQYGKGRGAFKADPTQVQYFGTSGAAVSPVTATPSAVETKAEDTSKVQQSAATRTDYEWVVAIEDAISGGNTGRSVVDYAAVKKAVDSEDARVTALHIPPIELASVKAWLVDKLEEMEGLS